MTDINFCSMPYLSIDYSNVIDFESRESRNNFFDLKKLDTIEGNIKYDNARTVIDIKYNMEYVRNFDYLYFTDSHDDKTYFYFIIDTEMVTKGITRIHIKLDVFTTYSFEYQIMKSFVDRCHVPRWNGDVPTYNLEDEGLEKGEIIQISQPQEICEMENAIVVCSSVPIGYVPGSTAQGGNGGNWEEGQLSSKGFRFIKGMEGFGKYAYQDGGGYWTIAYGVTNIGESDIYSQLKSKEPIQEEEGAKISYELKNSRYGLKILDTCKRLGVTKQCQFDALVSLAYNSGNGSVTGDNSLMRAIANDINDESTIRPIWESFKTTSNGIPQAGLVILRREQCNMFFGKEFEIRPISIINSSGGYDGYVTENDGDGWLPTDNDIAEKGDFNGYKNFSNSYGDSWLCPVKGGTVTSKYGWRIHPITGVRKFHAGTDIGMGYGKPTVASKSGTITQIGYHESMGNYIFLKCGDYTVKYMHLSKITVTEGQTVKRGDKVGEIGSTGSSTGSHCHWEIVNSDGESTDPAPSLQRGDTV